jgi:hypothetical protein
LNANVNLKFDKDGKPRPWTIEELEEEFGPEKNTDRQEDEIGLQGDNLKADYRPPPVTFRNEKWTRTKLSKWIRSAADSIRKCAEYSVGLRERIECLKHVKRDYQDMLLGFSQQLGELLKNGERNDDLRKAMDVVRGYIDETDQALREAVAEYRKELEPAGGEEREKPAQEHPAAEEPEPEGASGAYVFRKDGDTWEIVFEGERLPRFTHLDGYSYLQYLLEHPNQEVNAIELYGIIKHAPDSTTRFSEQDYQASEFSRDTKNIGWPSDQMGNARTNVTHAINGSKEKIRDKGGATGEKLWLHLEATLTTGNEVVYYPVKDFPHKDISWIT